MDGMAQEGLVTKREDGRYELSEKGKQETDFPFGFARVRSVEEMLSEMSGFISYIEDLNRIDQTKIAPYIEKMRSLGERLSELTK